MMARGDTGVGSKLSGILEVFDGRNLSKDAGSRSDTDSSNGGDQFDRAGELFVGLS